MLIRRLMVCLGSAIAVSLTLNVPQTAAIEIRESRWNFDGKAVSGKFNLLSVLVDNPAEENVEVVLDMADGVMKHRESAFLGPHQSRWVQFFPFVELGSQNWHVSWRDQKAGVQRYDVSQQASVNWPEARVRLFAEGSLIQNRSGWSLFPDELFPTCVTGMDTLTALVLDYAPRWEASRRRALMEWIHGGGRLIIAPKLDGAYPEFVAEMAPLNAPLDEQELGRGKIVKISRDTLESPLAMNKLAEPAGDRAARDYQLHFMNSVPSILREITTVDHNWHAIHALALVYLGIVCPGWYMLARQRIHYAITFGMFVGVVAAFVGVFNIIGRRGFGESTQVNSLAWARPVGKEAYRVAEWCNIFVTSGDFYRASYQGDGHVFALCQAGSDTGAVVGTIESGAEGGVTVDIPLFSSRTFLHMARRSGPAISVEPIEKPQSTGDLGGAKWAVKGLSRESVIQAIAIFHNEVYKLRIDPTRSDAVIVIAENREWLTNYIQIESAIDNASRYGPGDGNGHNPNQERARDILVSLLPTFVVEALDIENSTELRSSLKSDEMCFFVVAVAPDDWRMEGDVFTKQRQLVAYELRTRFQRGE